MRALLTEESKYYIYNDLGTGKRYVFDGNSLIELPDPDNVNDNKPPYHIETDDDEPDDTELNDDDNDSDGNGQGSKSGKQDSQEEEQQEQEKSSQSSQQDNDENDEDDDDWEDDGDSDWNDDEEDEDSDSSSNSSQNSSSNSSGKQNSTGEQQNQSKQKSSGEYDPQEDVDEITDKDVDYSDWDEIKDVLDEIQDKIDDLSEEDRQKFYDTLRDQMHKVDKDLLEKENEERQKEIEEASKNYDSDKDPKNIELKEIADDLNDTQLVNDLLDETDRKVFQDRQQRRKERQKAEAEANKYNVKGGSADFLLDINKLIKREVKKINTTSWGRINKKSEGSGVIKPGKTKKRNPEIPRLFIYFDQSGSWGESDLEVGKTAISSLNQYVKKGKLVIEVYYFANKVHSDAASARAEGGTGAGYELMQHIAANKPDNVVVMTDHDFDSWGDIKQAAPQVVKGGVFLLFRNGEISKELIARLRGKLFTKVYEF